VIIADKPSENINVMRMPYMMGRCSGFERLGSIEKALKQFVVWHNGHFHIWIVPDPPLVV
jgi:hypothetical protein